MASPAPPRRRHSITDRVRSRRIAAGQLPAMLAFVRKPVLAATVLVHLAVGAMPIVFLISVSQALARMAMGAPGEALWLGLALAAFVAQQVLAPVQPVLSYAVCRDVDTRCSTRLMEFTLARAPLAAVETAAVAAELAEVERSLDDLAETPGGAAEGALSLIARYTQLLGAVAVLAVAAGAVPAALGLAVALVLRFGQTEALIRWGEVLSSLKARVQRMMYLRHLGTGTRAAKEIRTLGLATWVERRYAAEADGFLRPLWSLRRRIYGYPFALYAVLALAGAVGLLLGVAGANTTTETVASVAMASQAALLCVRFGVLFPEADVRIVYGRKAWQAQLRAERLGADVVTQDLPPAPPPRREIAFREVDFDYGDGRTVLTGLTLVLPAGSSTAVVGTNGAGKTTTVKLLTGLYRPTRGTITCDGVDIADTDPRSWQNHFAVVFQDFVRYELSLRDNVAMGRIEHRDDDTGIRTVLRSVGLGDLCDALDTPLSRLLPGGRDLSGGQWQRVAIARSLFSVRHGASILILDEPTAQLDARGEAEFYEVFLELTRGVTSLVISHRFSSVRRADRIVVLADGRVAESGTHDELVRSGGRYAELFTAQASRFAANGAEA